MEIAASLAYSIVVILVLHLNFLRRRLLELPVVDTQRLVAKSPGWAVWAAIIATGMVNFASISLFHARRTTDDAGRLIVHGIVTSLVYHCTKRWMPAVWHVLSSQVTGIRFPRFKSLTRYEYSALPQHHVRLVRINGPFCRHKFQLLQFPLQDCPAYDAVSYTWDGQKNDRLLRLGDAHLGVTENASIILHGSVPWVGSRYMWIDSVCINQDDLHEKKTQIRIMQKIYQRAACVRVWLLPPKTMQSIVRPPEWEHDAKMQVVCENIFTSSNAVLGNHLENLLSHPYWNRVWIVQELAASQKAIIHFRHYAIDWNVLLAFADKHWPQSLHERFQVQLSSFAVQFEKGASANTLRGIRQISTIGHHQRKLAGGDKSTVSSLLTDFAGCRATNPLDNVYGLVGIASPELSTSVATNAMKFYEIDYGHSPLKVYTDTIKAAMRLGKAYTAGNDDFASEILMFSGVGWPRSVTNLPSWVTDWSSLPDCLIDSFTRFRRELSAGGGPYSRASPNYMVRGNSLLVSGGCRVDSISAITQTIDHDKLDRPWFSEICRIVASQLSLLSVNDVKRARYGRDYRQCPPRWQGAIFRTLVGEPASYWEMKVGDGFEYDRPDAYRDWDVRQGRLKAAGLREYHHRNTLPNLSDLRDSFDLWSNLPLLTQRLDDIVHTSILRDQPELQGRQLTKEIAELTQSLRSEIREHCAQFVFVCRQQTQGRCFALTRTGYMCLVPPGSRIGDELFVFESSSLPYLIRLEDSSQGFRKQPQSLKGYLVGSCFVLGLMRGEGPHAADYQHEEERQKWETKKGTVVLL
ncbi:HET domain protein [Metarhizium anisopliae]